MFAFVKKLIAKKNNATVSIIQTLHGIGKRRIINEISIPNPHTLNMMFLFLFLSVISPSLFVNRKIEL
jgi:hypothetical protein